MALLQTFHRILFRPLRLSFRTAVSALRHTRLSQSFYSAAVSADNRLPCVRALTTMAAGTENSVRKAGIVQMTSTVDKEENYLQAKSLILKALILGAETLMRCRAIENQCYVVAAAQVGQHNKKRSSYGHSMVVDPWGSVLVDMGERPPDVEVFDIDLSYLDTRRTEMPVWQHRRHDLYGTIEVTGQVPIDSQDSYQFGQVNVLASQVFYRSPLSVAFVNRKPVVPGHVLVTPVRHVERFCDLTAVEISDMFLTVQRVSLVVERHHGASSLTVGIQDGPDAGQTIKHVHVHVLPRKPGDFTKNDDIYKHLEEHDKDVSDSEWRTDEDMIQEALLYRPYFT